MDEVNCDFIMILIVISSLDLELRLFFQHLFHFMSSVHAERMGSSMDAAQLVREGNASVTLTKLKVLDEGAYICTVSIGIFHAQQVIQLHIIRKFHHNLSIQKNPLNVSQLLLCFSLCQNHPVFHSQRRSWC